MDKRLFEEITLVDAKEFGERLRPAGDLDCQERNKGSLFQSNNIFTTERNVVVFGLDGIYNT